MFLFYPSSKKARILNLASPIVACVKKHRTNRATTRLKDDRGKSFRDISGSDRGLPQTGHSGCHQPFTPSQRRPDAHPRSQINRRRQRAAVLAPPLHARKQTAMRTQQWSRCPSTLAEKQAPSTSTGPRSLKRQNTIEC